MRERLVFYRPTRGEMVLGPRLFSDALQRDRDAQAAALDPIDRAFGDDLCTGDAGHPEQVAVADVLNFGAVAAAGQIGVEARITAVDPYWVAGIAALRDG